MKCNLTPLPILLSVWREFLCFLEHNLFNVKIFFYPYVNHNLHCLTLSAYLCAPIYYKHLLAALESGDQYFNRNKIVLKLRIALCFAWYLYRVASKIVDLNRFKDCLREYCKFLTQVQHTRPLVHLLPYYEDWGIWLKMELPSFFYLPWKCVYMNLKCPHYRVGHLEEVLGVLVVVLWVKEQIKWNYLVTLAKKRNFCLRLNL